MHNNELAKFNLIRPILSGMNIDKNKFPIIKNEKFDDFFSANLTLTNYTNMQSVGDKKHTILDLFNNDKVLESFWNNTIKYPSKFEGFYAISSPDYSIYPNMNIYEIQHNIFKSRYVGALWQTYGVPVIPTVSWAEKDTYDICFSGLEKESIVMISTLGVSKRTDLFLSGFNYLNDFIKPRLIIVVGKIIEGMTGKFLLYSLKDTFNPSLEDKKCPLFEIGHYLEISNN